MIEKSGSKKYGLRILGVPDDAIVFNVDDNFRNDRLFAGKHGECKRSDYIIFSEKRRVVVFIELKKGTSSSTNTEIVNQLKGGFCVFEYYRSVAKMFFNKDMSALYEPRFVSFVGIGKAKRRPRTDRRAGGHNTPDNMMKIVNASAIQFNRVAALRTGSRR